MTYIEFMAMKFLHEYRLQRIFDGLQWREIDGF